MQKCLDCQPFPELEVAISEELLRKEDSRTARSRHFPFTADWKNVPEFRGGRWIADQV